MNYEVSLSQLSGCFMVMGYSDLRRHEVADDFVSCQDGRLVGSCVKCIAMFAIVLTIVGILDRDGRINLFRNESLILFIQCQRTASVVVVLTGTVQRTLRQLKGQMTPKFNFLPIHSIAYQFFEFNSSLCQLTN